MLRMGSARRQVEEIGFVRCGGILVASPANRVVGQHMVQRFTLGQYIAVKRRDTAVKTGMPLIQVAANEAEEIFEAKSGGPQIERARGAGLPGRDVMMLAKKSRIIAIRTQTPWNGCGGIWNFRPIERTKFAKGT